MILQSKRKRAESESIMKSQYRKFLDQNECPGCVKRAPVPGKSLCERCGDSHNRAMKKYYKKNKARLQARARAAYHARFSRKARAAAMLAAAEPTMEPQDAHSSPLP
jgi:hypothetical protein